MNDVADIEKRIRDFDGQFILEHPPLSVNA